MTAAPAWKDQLQVTASLRGRQAVVTEGNACGAISWYCVKICTMYQEIATGFALAMTYKPSAGSSHGVLLYHKINKNGCFIPSKML